jgi:hypothetical protein
VKHLHLYDGEHRGMAERVITASSPTCRSIIYYGEAQGVLHQHPEVLLHARERPREAERCFSSRYSIGLLQNVPIVTS